MKVVFLIFVLILHRAIQDNISVELERSELIKFDKNIYYFMKVWTSYKNRTVKSLNSEFQLKVPLPDDYSLVTTVYQFLSNEYRVTPIIFGMEFKNILSKKMRLFDVARMYRECSEPRMQWPLKTNVTYRVRNWVPDAKNFPPGMILGKFKAVISHYINNNEKNILEHQNGMKIDLHRIGVEKSDKKYVSAKLWVDHYNRTTKTFNCDMTYFAPFPDDSMFVISVLQLYSNEYRPTPIMFGMSLKKLLTNSATDFFNINQVFKKYDPPLTWPIKVNVRYKLRNYTFEQRDNYPSGLPSGNYKVVTSYYHGNKVKLILETYICLEISYPVNGK